MTGCQPQEFAWARAQQGPCPGLGTWGRELAKLLPGRACILGGEAAVHDWSLRPCSDGFPPELKLKFIELGIENAFPHLLRHISQH